MRLSQGAEKAILLLTEAGYEAFAVGGCVRDAILGKDVHDFDINTSATPEEMLKVFENERVFETGIKHGTITFVYNKENVELTTYRVDGEYKDNRHPVSVEFTKSLENDLKRRDFTMNSIVYNRNDGFIDMFNGKRDIENKLIRAIGIPEKRFEEDALRILRAVRFSSTLGFKIEEKTKKAMVKCKKLLHNISEERIATEINKFLLGDNVKNALLENYDILGEIIPEIEKMKDFDQRTPWHVYDILTHTAIVVESIPKRLHLRLSALLHDTGKVHTFFTDENGIGHFYGHNEVSGEIAYNYLTKYKYDNFTRDRVHRLVKIHDSKIDEDRVLIKKRINRIGKDCFFDLIQLKKADNMAQNPEKSRMASLEQIEKIAYDIINESCLDLKTLAINGYDLIKAGHKPGKNLGTILDTLLNEVIEEKLLNEKGVLLKRAEEIKEKEE